VQPASGNEPARNVVAIGQCVAAHCLRRDRLYVRPIDRIVRRRAMPTIDTPCIKVCVLDPVSGLCTGCGRTIDEIGKWASLSASERRRVMDALPARMRQRRAAGAETA